MKGNKKILIFSILISIALWAFQQRKNKSLLPPGFVLIAGSDSVAPFLISENPVSNYEYLLYTEWLRKVFIDYPEIYENAKPHSKDSSIEFPVNDPFSYAYFGHPAYSNYPVVGVNWEQAMDFCAWRTDRLNESMLMELGKLNWDKEMRGMMDENNFQTEAFVNQQFYFTGKPLKNQNLFNYVQNRHGDWEIPTDFYSSSKINSADLYPGFFYGGRLPTEDEWVYYLCQKIVRRTDWYCSQSFTHWAGYLNISEQMTENYLKTGEFIFREPMREWMMDTFTTETVKYINTEQRLQAAALKTNKTTFRYADQYGSLQEKDSLGRFCFRIFGWNPSGEAICAERYTSLSRFVTHDYLKEKSVSFCDSVRSIYLINHLDSFRKNYNLNNAYQLVRGENYMLEYYRLLLSVGGIDYTVNLSPFVSVEADLDYLTGSAQYAYNYKHQCRGCETPGGKKRVTCKGTERKAEPERNGQNDLGFRVLIPWYGSSIGKPIKW